MSQNYNVMSFLSIIVNIPLQLISAKSKNAEAEKRLNRVGITNKFLFP